MKKRILVLTMSLVMMLSIAACGSKPADGKGATPESQKTDVENTLDETNAPEETTSPEENTGDDETPAESDQVSEPASGYDSLQAWMESEEAAATVEAVNDMLASSGMTVKMSADGNVLVYEYYVSDALGLSEVSEEDIAAAFEASVESQRASVATAFDGFETQYGLKLDAIRYSYYTEDGSRMLYSADIANE